MRPRLWGGLAGLVVLSLYLFSQPAVGQIPMAALDGSGRITALTIAGEDLPITLNFRLPQRGWARQPSLSEAREIKSSVNDGQRSFAGRIEVAPGCFYRYVESLHEQDGQLHIAIVFEAEAEADLEGVFLWLDLPQDRFRGGQARLTAGGADVGAATMPLERPASRHFLQGQADTLICTMPEERGQLVLRLDRPLPIVVQDNREWGAATYSAFCRLSPALQMGESTRLAATLTATLRPDTRPATLRLEPQRVRYRFDGFGGNYCFAIESPVTQYTLTTLKQAWARTELTAAEWEPQNDNDDPQTANWEFFESRDTPGSNLRREFELAKQIQERGLRYVISIWDLPAWLYEDEGRLPRQARHRLHPDKWTELLELLGTYLLYAKRRYGVEPDLFCFNEPNIGVRVYFSAEEHREALKRIGAHFRALGLKTRLLLGDATGPRGTHTYARPAAEDPEALAYVGAVGFHSWGGGSPADYEAWAALAERLGLPLLVTELGVDAGAWRTQAYDNYAYAMQELRMYQELLLYARPQGTMHWEFTADYSLLNAEKDAEGNVRLRPTPRYWFVKHFCNLTPYHSEALVTASDHPHVLMTAFRKEAALTLHIANLGAARRATLTGLPASVKSLHAVRTSATEGFRRLDDVPVKNGTLRLELPAQCLLTLTTISPG